MGGSLSTKKTPIRVILPYALFGVGIFLFWFLRIYYWQITHEEPFSDMRGYNNIAKQLLQEKIVFGLKSFSRDKTSVLPLARAFQIGISGDSLFGWQFFQTSLLFFGLLWCMYEIRRRTGKLWLGIAFFFSVAISKSSIFWSYKIAMEGFTEVSIYLSIAIFLFSFRKQQPIYFLFSGLSTGVLSLHRLNFIVTVPLLVLIIYLQRERKQRIQVYPASRVIKKQVASLALFLAGIIVAWAPLIASNYMRYHELLLLPTQAGRSFFAGVGKQTVTLEDGSQIFVDTSSSFVEKPQRNFKNESEALRFHMMLFSRWVKQNPRLYLRRYKSKLRRLFYDRKITLTKVSRKKLFPGYMNSVLIDKSPLALFFGCIGLIFLGLRYSAAMYIFAVFALIPIFAIPLMSGNPRYIEPMIPVILFANTLYISLLLDLCKRKLK